MGDRIHTCSRLREVALRREQRAGIFLLISVASYPHRRFADRLKAFANVRETGIKGCCDGAGRRAMTDEMQALCFFAGANSIFVGDTLLTAGNPGRRPGRGPIPPPWYRGDGTRREPARIVPSGLLR